MNKKAYTRRNEVTSHFKNLSGSFSNCIKIIINPNNPETSRKHELAKCERAIELIMLGSEIYTEAELRNGKGRCDILAIDTNGDGSIHEIMNSESKESIEEKRKIYPFPIICHKI
jgi:hypothetical protein